jgi:hypothetical protein
VVRCARPGEIGLPFASRIYASGFVRFGSLNKVGIFQLYIKSKGGALFQLSLLYTYIHWKFFYDVLGMEVAFLFLLVNSL